MNNDKTVNTLQNDNAVYSPFFVYCFFVYCSAARY